MRTKTLQICFVLDCTESMVAWTDAAKDRLLDTIRMTRERYPEYVIQAAFIGYRDFHDEEQFIRIDFTSNLDHIQNVIMDVVADGGDDICEDVAGAYRFVNGLSWDADVRCVFHITDAPNHGRRYHEPGVDDDYPGGHPYISLDDEVRELAHKGIELTVFSIKASTDIMYRRMRDIYQAIQSDGFHVVNLRNRTYNVRDTFVAEVSQRLNSSLDTSNPR
jgi:hypothetical protein